MAGIAYSYLRFSTPEQAAGDSRRRQTALALRYAAEHQLKLDHTLSFKDLGVSAYRGENAKEGALRAFLEAIEHGLVPIGSTLLVESLDRLSRDRIIAAQSLFLQIVQAGVTIVTLADQRSYSIESLNRNPLDLIVSLVVLMRANEESATKSERIRAAFEQKRANLATRPWSARCPGWLRLDKVQRQFVIVEDRANVVRRIFREALDGVGHETIARRLNEEDVPLFGQGNQRGKFWTRSFIRHLLRYPAVIGDFTPTTTEWVDGIRRVHPLTTVPGYYPAIISVGDWETIQTRRIEWSKHHRNQVPKSGRANLLAGLARCPYCGTSMTLRMGGSLNWRYYTCRKAFFSLGCSDRWVRYPGIEETFTRGINEVIESCPAPQLDTDVRAHRLAHIRTRLATLRARKVSIEADRPRNWQISRPTREAAESVDAEIGRLLTDRSRLRGGGQRWLDMTLQPRLDKVRALAVAKNVDRHALNTALRSVLEKVVIDWPEDRLILVWKHGGQSHIPANVEPLRLVTNPRRSDRRRFGLGKVPAPLRHVER